MKLRKIDRVARWAGAVFIPAFFLVADTTPLPAFTPEWYWRHPEQHYLVNVTATVKGTTIKKTVSIPLTVFDE